MKSHDHHLWPRLLATLIFGSSLTVALLWLLAGARLPAAQASPPARPLFAPRPASTDPISNALNVPIIGNVSITFDEPISLTSVTSDTFAVYGSQSPIFTGTYSLSDLSRTVTLDPARAFFPGERVDATVTTATLNITGQQAISSTVWQFWAAVEGGSGAFAAHPISDTFGGGTSMAVALGDVDGDGHLDAVVANFGASQDVYLNDGTGRFAAHPISDTFGAGDSTAVALGDVDGDGDLDALVANYSDEAQDVYLNDGTGRFAAHPISPTFGAGQSLDVALGDVDGDGHLDALVANWNNQAQDVYLNDGTGRFATHPISPTFGAGSKSTDVALGDVDGDGDLDAVVANYLQRQDVYLNDETGRFAAHPISPTFSGNWSRSRAVALGDVDGDGHLDAVVANNSGQAQDVYLNDGTGLFAAHPISPTFGAGDSEAVALGDVDGDGDLDALVANDNGLGQAQDVYLNDGTGLFAAHPISPTFGAGDSRDVALGDVDGDGDLDAVVANWIQDQTVWLNRSYQVYMPVIMRAYP